MLNAIVCQVPVHLVEHNIQLLLITGPSVIFFDDHIADRLQFFLAESGAGGVLRRAKTDKNGILYMWFDIGGTGHEIVFRPGFHHNMFAFHKMNVMIIVPGGNGIDYFIAFIANGTEQSINQRTPPDAIRISSVLYSSPWYCLANTPTACLNSRLPSPGG
jgi:hypothetical protein